MYRGFALSIAAMCAAGLAGCAAPRQAYQSQSTVMSLQAQREAIIERQHHSAMEPYVAWINEAPPSCSSATLAKAHDTVLFVASITDPQTQGFDAALRAGTWVLDVADGAKDRGCKDTARDLYTQVVRMYVGAGYSGLRDRAAMGLADLR